MFDYNRDGKVDHKDRITEMMLINNKEYPAKKTGYTKNTERNKGCYGCVVYILAVITIFIAIFKLS